MRTLFIAAAFLIFQFTAQAQSTPKLPNKYPSLLWEITGNGMKKPSYLFGTMHVSSKMVFHLSDSFYLGIRNADVVALETDMSTWQEDFSRYELGQDGMYQLLASMRNNFSGPDEYLTINTLRIPSYEKLIESALNSSPSLINNFLYRSYSDRSSDFEEDTYLDLHIYQVGKKWGKVVTGVENFDRSMELMKEAYQDAAKEKDKKVKSYDLREDFSYSKLEDAYRSGNLDLLDTINKVNSTSAAFDEKFLYRRNEIQARSMDSIMRSGSSLFTGVGAAHLPGQRGVIELLRRKGYHLRPIMMTERDSRQKEEVEKIRVPVRFSRQVSADGFYSVNLPGKLYDFDGGKGALTQLQYADMSNGSYYTVTRIHTNTVLWGHSTDMVLKKIDSVIYENIPGKILSRKPITRNGYKGFEVVNRTRRGDYQRYNIFVTPFEIILFKMSGNGEYVKDGTEADQFFSSIQLKHYANKWNKWSPAYGGFEVELPQEPLVQDDDNMMYVALDSVSGTGMAIIRTDIDNYNFVEEDSFDLNLLEESFSSSEFISKAVSRKHLSAGGYSALDVQYKYKDGSVALARFLVQGSHYYTIVAHARKQNPVMSRFVRSFAIRPFIYGQPEQQSDTSLYYTVSSPVPLEKSKKLSLVPDNLSSFGRNGEEAQLDEHTTIRNKVVSSDETGEKINVSFRKPSRYYFNDDSASQGNDTLHWEGMKMNWTFRSRHRYELPNKMKVMDYVIGDPSSSRYIRGKVFSKDAVIFRLETEGDTISRESSFITGFFNSFVPSDTVKGTDARERKSKLFFSDFFSSDTMLHKRAVHNVNRVTFDSTDFADIRRSIGSLGWQEKKYMEVKKDFIGQLASLPTNESADYLKQLYFAAGDTIEFQYTALLSLLQQGTPYAFGVFRDIMVTDPPVLDFTLASTTYSPDTDVNIFTTAISSNWRMNSGYGNNSFMDVLSDSLQQTADIFKDLLPLVNINDYEQPLLDLLGKLVDSSMISPKVYESYQQRFLIEAKQQLKKQAIRERTKSIARAQADDDENQDQRKIFQADPGNNQLSLYATLLMPFWDSNPAVQPLINRLLSSDDKKLKYNTAMMLLRNNRPVPDTMISYFAGLDEYRYDLYSDLTDLNLLNRFPVKYNNPVELGKSSLLGENQYYRPDTIVYLDRLPLKVKQRSGYVYFFKYRQNRNDNSWKLATVGLVPQTPGQFEFPSTDNERDNASIDFTDLSDTKLEEDSSVTAQMQKLLKKMVYSKRNSASEFYQDNERPGMDFLRAMNFRD